MAPIFAAGSPRCPIPGLYPLLIAFLRSG